MFNGLLNAVGTVFPLVYTFENIDNFSLCVFANVYPDLWTNKLPQVIREKKRIPS
jgi:hypothetical protein